MDGVVHGVSGRANRLNGLECAIRWRVVNARLEQMQWKKIMGDVILEDENHVRFARRKFESVYEIVCIIATNVYKLLLAVELTGSHVHFGDERFDLKETHRVRKDDEHFTSSDHQLCVIILQ